MDLVASKSFMYWSTLLFDGFNFPRNHLIKINSISRFVATGGWLLGNNLAWKVKLCQISRMLLQLHLLQQFQRSISFPTIDFTAVCLGLIRCRHYEAKLGSHKIFTIMLLTCWVTQWKAQLSITCHVCNFRLLAHSMYMHSMQYRLV